MTPDNATSPMDAAQTQRIPREVVSGDDPDPTLQLQGQETEGSAAWPTEDYRRQQHDHYGRPAGQQGPAQPTPDQQYPGQQPGDQGPPRAPQWPTAPYQGDQYQGDQYSTDQSSADEWSWPATRFGPLNPETARGLQW